MPLSREAFLQIHNQDCLEQELMMRVAHATQVDLGFRDAAGEFLSFGVRPDNFPRECFRLFGQGWRGVDGQAQRVAKRWLETSSSASTAHTRIRLDFKRRQRKMSHSKDTGCFPLFCE